MDATDIVSAREAEERKRLEDSWNTSVAFGRGMDQADELYVDTRWMEVRRLISAILDELAKREYPDGTVEVIKKIYRPKRKIWNWFRSANDSDFEIQQAVVFKVENQWDEWKGALCIADNARLYRDASLRRLADISPYKKGKDYSSYYELNERNTRLTIPLDDVYESLVKMLHRVIALPVS